MTVTATSADERWLRREVVKELMKNFHYSKAKALSLFKDSPLPKMIYSDPDYIFHYDPEYWAESLVTMSKERYLQSGIENFFNMRIAAE